MTRRLWALALVWAVPLGAQSAPASLARVDSLVATGLTEEARTELSAWWGKAAPRADRDDLQRGIWLRALLTVDPTQAAVDYQRLVVEYPGGAWSDRALLRLAQIAVARRDTVKARTQVRALLRDYPASPVRAEEIGRAHV